jgi:hypothetical protein
LLDEDHGSYLVPSVWIERESHVGVWTKWTLFSHEAK